MRREQPNFGELGPKGYTHGVSFLWKLQLAQEVNCYPNLPNHLRPKSHPGEHQLGRS